jgi:hypothetical protein
MFTDSMSGTSIIMLAGEFICLFLRADHNSGLFDSDNDILT